MNRRVILCPNPTKDDRLETSRQAKAMLERAGFEVCVCPEFVDGRPDDLPADLPLRELEDVIDAASLVVSLGGDGTIMHTARRMMGYEIPIIGVNLGTMGFMAELESNELELLPEVLADDIPCEDRMMIHVAVKRGGRVIYEDNALNDAVITKGAIARVIQMTMSCDGVEAMHFDGDGIIICTPTGSTAYSMSAGGPIVEPTAKNIIVTPICAHTIGIRSLVLMHDRVVTVQVGRVGNRNAFLSVDGGKAVKLSADDQVVVTASRRCVRLAKIKSVSYYSTINQKFQR